MFTGGQNKGWKTSWNTEHCIHQTMHVTNTKSFLHYILLRYYAV